MGVSRVNFTAKAPCAQSVVCNYATVGDATIFVGIFVGRFQSEY